MTDEKQPPPKGDGRGVECPACGCPESQVYYTRRLAKKIRRRRICDHCGRKFTTSEAITG